MPPTTRLGQLKTMAILSALLAFASIATDLYLPALPTMARALHADHGAMELTISGYLVGFSLGQLLWGPIADRYGRRWPTAAGMLLFVVGSVGCALSTGPWQMIGWRIVQAIGGCAGVVLSRAMVRDLYDRDRAAEMLSTLIVIMAIAPLIGPLLGGQILAHGSWQAIFWLLAAIGLVTLAALFTMPETLPPDRRNPEPLLLAMIRYGELARDRQVLGYAGAGGFFYVGIYAYVAGTPFAYITYYGVPPQLYGLLFGCGIVGIMSTNLLNKRLVRRYGSDRLMQIGSMGTALAGIAALLAAATGWGGLAGLAAPMLLYVGSAGFIVANSLAGALVRYPLRAGAASALVGAVHYGSGIFGSALVGALADGTPRPLGLVLAIGGIGSALSARFLVRKSD